MLSIISIFVAIGGLIIAYRTFLSQKGGILVKITNFPLKKHIGDLNFEENIPDIKLKLVNVSDFPVTVEKIYLTLGSPEEPKLYTSRNLLKSWEHKYITLEPEFNQLHLNIIKEPLVIESSHAKYISLVDNLIKDNFCSENEHFCLVIKHIRVVDSIGTEWTVSDSDELKIQEYTYSFQTWKNIQDIINMHIESIRIWDTDSSDKEVRDRAVQEIKKELDI